MVGPVGALVTTRCMRPVRVLVGKDHATDKLPAAVPLATRLISSELGLKRIQPTKPRASPESLRRTDLDQRQQESVLSTTLCLSRQVGNVTPCNC
jgi:hypothetical protein